MKGFSITDIGKSREKNQDAFLRYGKELGSLPNLYIVADGMGGHNAGEVASHTSIYSFFQYVSKNRHNKDNILDFLIDATKYANNRVYKISVENLEYSGMGTTFTTVCILNGKVYSTHVGDSRLYLINEKGIRLMTTDHSYINEIPIESRNYPENIINKHILTRALGTEPLVAIDGIVFDVKDKDKILLCSDGLTNMVNDSKIYEVVKKNDIKTAGKKLVNLANGNGGNDNITLILIEIEGETYAS
ncbi:MAG: Stp1/IreP family PP2C-type Ser/Thr phosphatase [Defluviitaleaceae bacterium]|nr:Stp1/IreP family PP2C-type Ser/Thr phosphatase [Defluviitaleaceae bacterium]